MKGPILAVAIIWYEALWKLILSVISVPENRMSVLNVLLKLSFNDISSILGFL
jgi:hypothetical protein